MNKDNKELILQRKIKNMWLVRFRSVEPEKEYAWLYKYMKEI